jgi:hypothetical protein
MPTKSNKSSESKAAEDFKHAVDEKGKIAAFAENNAAPRISTIAETLVICRNS